VSIPLTRHANTISSVLRVEAPTNYRELDIISKYCFLSECRLTISRE
jgi:hypothetical protein